MADPVVGDRELIRNLGRMTQVVGGQTLDAGMKQSLEPMRAETEKNARARRRTWLNPRGGHLDQGVVVAKRRSTGRWHREFWLSFKGRARRIAHLVEFGTRPHWQPRRKIMHPGARPYPFFRPAFESKKQEVMAIFGRVAWDLIRTQTLRITRGRR